MAVVTIAELDLNTDKLVSSASETKKAIQDLSDAQKILKVQGKQNSEEFVRNDVALKKLQKSYREQTKVIGELNLETQKELNLSKQITAAVDKEVKSIDTARKNNKELLIIRNKLNITTASGRKELDKINAKLDQNNNFIKANVDQYTKQKINIGNYEGALRSVFPQMGKVLTILKQSKVALDAYKASTIASTAATNASSKSLKFFKIALISTGVGAIVVAFGALITFLTSTQEGIDKVTKITKPLQVIFQSMLGVIQKLGGRLFKAFSNPKKLLSDLVDFIKSQVINRFKSISVILEGIINLDFKKIGDGFLQATTGVENLTDKIVASTEETKKFFDEAKESGLILRQLAIDIETAEANIVLQTAKITNKIKEQELIAKDRTKSDAERALAIEEALRLSKELLEAEQDILKLKIKEEILNQKFNDSGRKDLKKINELKAQLLASEEKQRTTELRFIGTKAQLENQAIARQKKAFDLAIKNQKTLLNLFIKSQGIFKKSLQEELQLSEQVAAKKLEILKQELQAEKITANEFALASLELENDLARQRAEIAVSVAERELESFKLSHQSKLDANLFFTDELLEQEQTRLDNIAAKEIAFQEKRLLQGVINEEEYLAAVATVQDNHRKLNEELEIQRAEASKEKQIIDLENQRTIDEENFLNRFQIASGRLESERLQEVAAAEKTGADVTLINEKFAKRQQKIQEALQDSKIQSLKNTLGIVADTLGEETFLGKAAAIAQALINTYQGISAGVKLGYPAAIPAVAAAAVTGFGAVTKIAGVDASFYEGGLVPTGTGGRISGRNIPTQRGGDNILATVKSGEVILNDQQQQRAGGSAFFKSIGVPGFQTGGQVPSNLSTPIAQGELNQSSINDLASQINDIQTVLVVEDVSDLQGTQVEVIEEANI